MSTVLITRIAEEAGEYAVELKAAGFEVLSAPMLEIVPLDYLVPDMERYDGLIYTSAQAVRFFDESADVPVFCVGSYTAGALRGIGFSNVLSADGTAVDILPLLETYGKEGGRYLHVGGRDLARDLTPDVEALGMRLDRLVVYAAEPCDEIRGNVIAQIKNRGVDAVIFFSKRTVKNFLHLADKKGFLNDLKFVSALCISEGVRGCVQAKYWADVQVSRSPDRAGMLDLLQQWERCEHE